MLNGSGKFASFSAFANSLPKPQVLVIHLSKKLKVSSTMTWTTLCINRKHFGIVLLVMCEVALQSKLAQIIAPNVFCEAPLNISTVV